MGLQDFVDAVNEATRMERSKYHLTLGELLDALVLADSEKAVRFDSGGSPESPHSYRGFYSDLGLENTEATRTVRDVLDDLRDIHETELTGYKGGDFYMGDTTPLWESEWGAVNGHPILDVEIGESVILVLGESEL